MKKILTLCAALVIGWVAASADCQDGPYGLQINGSRVVDAPKFGDPDAQGRVQYKASCVSLAAGDVIKLINQSCDATWMVDIDPYGSYQSFEGGSAAGQLTCKTAGSYDFYIKLSASAGDLVYIGPGENCGGGDQGGQGGGQQGGGEEGGSSACGHDFYAIGWINGADAGETAYDKYDDKYLFANGKLAIDCQKGSYIAIKDFDGNFYYSRVETTINDSKATLDWANGWAGCQKWAIPEGMNYIIIRKIAFKGQIELERVDKATFDAYSLEFCDEEDAVETPTVKANVTKTIENGQVVLIKDGVRYNLLGAQLQ